jgi:hypothetical protein
MTPRFETVLRVRAFSFRSSPPVPLVVGAWRAIPPLGLIAITASGRPLSEFPWRPVCPPGGRRRLRSLAGPLVGRHACLWHADGGSPRYGAARSSRGGIVRCFSQKASGGGGGTPSSGSGGSGSSSSSQLRAPKASPLLHVRTFDETNHLTPQRSGAQRLAQQIAAQRVQTRAANSYATDHDTPLA